MLGPWDDELVIVSDGALCFTPWAAVIEAIRILNVLSLTTYQLISNVAEGHYKKTGALLVGNPCLNELRKPPPNLPCAQEEVDWNDCINSQRQACNRDRGNKSWRNKTDVVSWFNSYCCPRKQAHWRNCLVINPIFLKMWFLEKENLCNKLVQVVLKFLCPG